METFNYSIYINTTPEKLWEALTSSAFTKQYWAGLDMITDWKVGSPVRMVYPFKETSGTVLKYEPPKILSYTGIGGPSTAVTFEIMQVSPDEVRLNIHHESISENMKRPISEGWYAIMSSLKTLLETGKALDHSWWKG